jgi:hypothetical protein
MIPNVPNFTATTGTTNGASYTISNYKITPVNALLAPTSVPTTVTARYPSQNYIPYLATVDVTLPGLNPVTVKLSEVFQVAYNSPWNYAIFYNDALEINPGATMSVNGAVHTNNLIYAGAGGAQLTFLNSVDVSGTAAVNGKDPNDTDHGAAGSTTPGSETPPIFPPGYPVADTPLQWPFGINPALLSATSSNPNATGYQELIEPPTSGTSDPFSPAGQRSQRYYNVADYVVTLSGTSLTKPPQITVKGQGGTAVSSAVYNVFAQMAGATVPGGNTSQALTAGTTSFYDSREDATMETTNLNIATLTNAVNTAGTISNNPNGNYGLVVYVEDTRFTAPNQTTEPAIRLTNGQVLPSDGLTVVSPNPIYVQGDYNTGSTTTKPATDTGTPGATTNNTVGGYWEAAAIIGDAVSILSDNWSDANAIGSTSLSSRTATATTVNAGIMAGNVPDSTGVAYSGGAENFPRFLENWSGVWFSYYGSMVNLFASQQSTGAWASASYNPPERFWNYDSHFHTKPPPGTYTFPAFSKQQWFIRQ